ncbi:alpha/beta fold hydrolase [Microlunatus sp. Y2014]|uniref:alpha/beta fold hydrolase n=1 Tax=Microlunatus sp. Y2014 TaxID=3418488 RepID=UPI003DA70A3A
MATRFVSIDRARVAYRAAGDGPAIVLISNNRRPLDLPVASLLAANFRTYQVHPVGFGASDRPDSYDFGSIHRQVLGVLDHEQVNEFVVWGFSQTACMAALVARATRRAVALVAGGYDLTGDPTDTMMRRMEREPRLPASNLSFWRAYCQYDWLHELKRMPQPKLIYLGTNDPRVTALRRQAPLLQECGCDYLEFDGLDHASSGLGDAGPAGQLTTSAIAHWLRSHAVIKTVIDDPQSAVDFG